jgi:NodT family efflux transporter outer membrane factor (OMF) lipoprotein
MRNSIKQHALTLALFAALSSVGAQAAEAPSSSVPVPASFAWAPGQGAEKVAGDAEFWRVVADPILGELVDRALRENTDLRIAFARFEGANALLRGAKFDRLPTVRAQAGASDQLLSADQAPGLDRDARDSHSYFYGASLSWELDLFGRVRHGVEARRAEVGAASGDLQALQVAIVAQVSRDYLVLRGLQERLRVAQENSRSQAETLRLVEAGFAAGRGTEFDVARARSQLAGTSSRVPALEAEIATTLHHLAVLTGQVPEALLGKLDVPQALPALPPALDPGTPGELLLRRPDVAAAEARLAAATARIGVARADLFPRFTLGALFGGQSAGAGSLLDHDGETRLVALGIDWSFLDFGRVRAHIQAAHSDADAELAGYEQSILRALQETEDALVRYDRARSEDDQLAAAAVDSARAATLARLRYEAGAATLFEVLDAERSNLQAQDTAVQARTRSFTGLVDIYRALAGGWPTRLPSKPVAMKESP